MNPLKKFIYIGGGLVAKLPMPATIDVLALAPWATQNHT
jgi:hypothetical protein